MTIVVNKSVTGAETDNLSPNNRMIAVGSSFATMRNKWGKICSIRINRHQQGEFTWVRVFIGYGNNGNANQNAYFDLFGQLGWTGSNGGIAGWTAVLHPCASSFTTSNIDIKVIANSNVNYDIYFQTKTTDYCVPNIIFMPSAAWRYGRVAGQTSCVVYDPVWDSNAPSGTEAPIVIVAETAS